MVSEENKEVLTMNEPKRLYRVEQGAAVLSGVCGGIAEYLNLDPSLVRLVWAALSLGSVGGGVILYLVAAAILPRKSDIYPGY